MGTSSDIITPVNSNGKEAIQAQSADELRLAQMGACESFIY